MKIKTLQTLQSAEHCNELSYDRILETQAISHDNHYLFNY